MLQPILPILNSQRVILGSGSPRRKEILENIGMKFIVKTSNFDETLDKETFLSPEDYALNTAKKKVEQILKELTNRQETTDLIIGADTVVSLDGQIHEKPLDQTHAFDMLSRFSGRTHLVHTGVVLSHFKNDKNTTHTFTETTEVTMARLSPSIITSYIKTGEPMDKAGGYGIQGLGGSLIQSIHGDYYNVMGFPLHSFCKHLIDLYGKIYPEVREQYSDLHLNID